MWIRPSLFIQIVALSVGAVAAAAPPGRAQAPYFASPAGEGIEGLPLESTRTDVTVAGVVANAVVKQRYRNRGKTPIEAVYVFPGTHRSAVHALVMRIGDRVVRARIDEKEKARKAYDAAKAEGKTASLLEQDRPNVFTMRVANILPGDVIDVELDYAELLESVDGEYEVVIPGVVGPRYTGGATAKTPSMPATAHLRAGQAAPFDWDATVTIDAGVPVIGVTSPSHRIDTRIDGTRAKTAPRDGEALGNADFVVRYALRGDAMSSGLILFPGHEPGDEQFFLLNVQPPKVVDDAAVPPREYVFIVDVSGSMHGFPINTAKDLMNDLLAGLDSKDQYNILTFSGGSDTLADRSLPATPQNVSKGLAFMSRYAGGGGTEIVPALKKALSLPAADDMARVFVVVTDGYVSVEAEAFDLVAKNLGKASLFAFGIGTSVNRHLIDGLARAGAGEPFVVLGPDDVTREVGRLQKMIATPALTRVKVAFEGFDAYDVEPEAVPDLFAERPVVVFGKYRGTPKGRIVVSGHSGQGPVTRLIDAGAVRPDADNEALRVLWARHKVARLADNQQFGNREALKPAITALGLRYGILTAYTSFIAVDQRVRSDGTPVEVPQPLPLPLGVEDTAIPETVAMPVVQGLMLRGSGSGGGGVATGRIGPPAAAPVRRVRPSEAMKGGDKREDAPTALHMVVQVSQVSGALTAADARGMVAQLRRALFCLTGQGSGTLEIAVDASGRVVSVRLDGASLGDLGGCEGALKALVFRAAGGPSTISLAIHRG